MQRGQHRHHVQASTWRDNRSRLFLGVSSSSYAPRSLHDASAVPGGPSSVGPGTTNSNGNSTAMEAAGIQRSLERTQALLRHELERVSHVASTIDHDGKLLDETTNLHRQMNVKGAKKALSSLERAKQRHRRVLRCSLAFFWTVVFYVAWERVLTRLPLVDRGLQAVLRRLF